MRSRTSKTDGAQKDEVPMLLDTHSHPLDICMDVELPRFTARNRSASMSATPYSNELFGEENNLIFHSGPLTSERKTRFVHMSGPLHTDQKPADIVLPMKGMKSSAASQMSALEYPSVDSSDKNDSPSEKISGVNEHLLRSGKLGMCNDPYCTTCPMYTNYESTQPKNTKPQFESRFQNVPGRDLKGWVRRSFSSLYSYVPGIMNPHTKFVQQWNTFFFISCLVAIFVDPLFFFLLSLKKEYRCIVFHWHMAATITFIRSMTDFIYLIHMILQFRLAYVGPECRVVGAEDLVDHPKKVALHYLRGFFLIDLFVALPLPQIIIWFVIPNYVLSSDANYVTLLVLLQNIPRIVRCLPLPSARSPSIFETASLNIVINLLMFVLAGHVVGSCWYLFGLQRVKACLRNACSITNCQPTFMDCGYGENTRKFMVDEAWISWLNSSRNCLDVDGPFNYGMYQQAVNISTFPSIIIRYIYSFFWGFQQISNLAGNLVPSEFVLEVCFTVCIIGCGLFLFPLLIGNIQNFLQALGRRRLEMQLRRRDVEQWMSHRRLPEMVKRRVRESEQFNWAAKRGVNEEVLLETLPEDLQREIRRYLFEFVKKMQIFALMDDHIIDAICEKLRQKIYMKGSKILYSGAPVDKMVFIVRGEMESIDADGNTAQLLEGNVLGEELLTWCLERSVNKDGRKSKIPGRQLISNRTATCLTNVEAFSLRAVDLEEIIDMFGGLLPKPLTQRITRYGAPYRRGIAATRIHLPWRYRKKHLNFAHNFNRESGQGSRIMTTLMVPLICHYGGELGSNDMDPSYVGGDTKVLNVHRKITFADLQITIHELCSIYSPGSFDIKCRYRVDTQTVIALPVQDDTSLGLVLDCYPRMCASLIFYISGDLNESSNHIERR